MQSKGLRGGKKIETSKASMIAAWCLTAMLCLCGCGAKETSLYDRGLTDAGNGGGALCANDDSEPNAAGNAGRCR